MSEVKWRGHITIMKTGRNEYICQNFSIRERKEQPDSGYAAEVVICNSKRLFDFEPQLMRKNQL